jgi:hypothetical protein
MGFRRGLEDQAQIESIFDRQIGAITMRNIRLIIPFVIAASFLLLWLTQAGCSPAATYQSQPTPIATIAIDEALMKDGGSLAADLGITVDEAIRRLTLQNSIGPLDAQLERQESATFSGLWIQNKPEYRVVVAFTRDGPKTIKPYIENTPYESLVELRTVDVSLAELEKIQQEVMRMTRDFGLSFSSGINVQKNRVELYVTDQALWETSSQKSGQRLPEHVTAIIVYKPLGDSLPFALTPAPGVFFPQLRAQRPAYLEALLVGKLILESGCLRIAIEPPQSQSYLVIWEADYFLNDNNGITEVFDQDGLVAARVGDPIRLGGGAVPLSSFSSELRETIPDRCQGPYWLMGEFAAQK